MPDSYYPEQVQAMTMIVALLYNHAEYLRGGPYCSAFPSLLCYDSWIHYPDTAQWLGYWPYGSPNQSIRPKRGQRSVLTVFYSPLWNWYVNIDRTSRITARGYPFKWRMDKSKDQWINIHTARLYVCHLPIVYIQGVIVPIDAIRASQ